MIIYRPHRSTLDGAMKEAKEFVSENEMKKYIVNQWDNLFSIDDIVIEYETVNDDRIGWRDTRYICVKRMGNTIYDYPQCIGMCATDYDKLKEVEDV